MNNHSDWDFIFKQYAHLVTNPEGKPSFESSSKLVAEFIEAAKLGKGDTVVDMGCGWGNLSLQILRHSSNK